MTPEQQRIAIAEACGWRDKRVKTRIPDPRNGTCWITPDGRFYVNCPDYLNDLNAMHEAEKILDHDQRNRYINILDAIPDDSDPVQHDFQWCCATAAQRAEAFLRTLNLWTE